MKFTLTFEIPDGPEARSFHREPAKQLADALRFAVTESAPDFEINGVAFFVIKVEEPEGGDEIAAELKLLD